MTVDGENGEEPPIEEERPLGAEPEEGAWDDIHELHDPVMREHERPRDGFEPIEVWLILLFLALVGWGGWYLGVYSAAFSPEVTDVIPVGEQAVPAEPEKPQPVDVDPMALGEEMFSDCAACHQGDGSGVEGVFPPLVNNERVLGDPEPLAAIVLHGLQGPLVVDGVEYDDVMPGHGDWSDEEIAAVLTYVRNAWDHDEDPVDPGLVGEVRELTAEQLEPWTDPELREFFEDVDLEDDPKPEE